MKPYNIYHPSLTLALARAELRHGRRIRQVGKLGVRNLVVGEFGVGHILYSPQTIKLQTISFFNILSFLYKTFSEK